MLLGRSAAIAELDAALRAAGSGRSAVRVVVGAPGRGKTALLEAVRQHADGWRVLAVVASAAGWATAYAGLDSLLRPVRGRVRQLPTPYAAALSGALGEGDGEPAGVFQVAMAVLTLLSLISGDDPVLLLVDDAHWLDPQSLAVLGFVVRRLDHDAITVVLTARADTAAAAALCDLPPLPVPPLEDADARQLVRARYPMLSASAVERVVAACGGNPLALVEMGSALQHADRSPGELKAEPPFAIRVAQAGDGTRIACLLVALEPAATVALVGHALARLDLPPTHLDDAAAAGLVTIGVLGQVRLVHPLVADAVLAELPDRVRRRAHLALAGAIEPAPTEETGWRGVWHRSEAGEPDVSLAGELVAAGERAARCSDLASAAWAFRRAADLAGDRATRHGLLVRAGGYGVTAGLPWAADALREVQSEPASLRHKDRADVILAGYAGSVADYALAYQVADGWTDDQDPSSGAVVHAVAAAQGHLSWDEDRLRHHGRICRDLAARATGRERLLAEMILVHHDCVLAPRSPVAAVRRLAERYLEEPELHWSAPMIHLLMQCDQWDLAERVVDVVRPAAAATNAVPALVWVEAWSAEVHRRAGRLRAAESAAAYATSLATTLGNAMTQLQAEVLWAAVEADRGRSDQALERIQRLRPVAVERRIVWSEFWLGEAEARALAGLGRLDEAIETLGRQTARMDEMLHGTLGELPTRAELIDLLVQAGRLDEAAEECTAWRRAVQQDPLPSAVAWLAYDELCLAPDHELEARHASAVQAAGRAGLPVLVARADLRFGERLRRGRHRAEAATALERAARTFEAMAADGWADRARRELLTTGVAGVAALGPTEPALTPQEWQIAELAARGARTAEIAATVFLSRKTVEYHLTKVYRKLGLRSRTELAAWMAERS